VWGVLGKVVAIIATSMIVIALVAFAIYNYRESLRVPEVTDVGVIGKAELWFRSAMHLLAFSLMVLVVMIVVCALVYALSCTY